MDIYMSYSTNVRINEKEKDKRNWQSIFLVNLAISQYKKYHYNNIYLITDTEGKELFKDSNFTEIFNILSFQIGSTPIIFFANFFILLAR